MANSVQEIVLGVFKSKSTYVFWLATLYACAVLLVMVDNKYHPLFDTGR
jgi:hypothetical protein